MAEEQERLTFTGKGTPEGRPIFTNQFGDTVTERTITVEIPSLGGFVNVPTVLDGRFLTEQQAIRLITGTRGKDIVTGRQLPVFGNVKEAVAEAEQRSKDLSPIVDKILSESGPQGASFQ